MSRATADPVSLAVECPTCGRQPRSRCLGPYGGPTQTHLARVRDGLAAQERSRA